jgi:hypothetical protein
MTTTQNDIAMAAHIEADDLARFAQESDEFEAWMTEHVEEVEEEAFQAWAEGAREDGEDDSREAYEDYIDSLIPTD